MSAPYFEMNETLGKNGLRMADASRGWCIWVVTVQCLHLFFCLKFLINGGKHTVRVCWLCMHRTSLQGYTGVRQVASEEGNMLAEGRGRRRIFTVGTMI